MPLMVRDKKLEKIADKFNYKPKEKLGKFRKVSSGLAVIRAASGPIYDKEAAKYFTFNN